EPSVTATENALMAAVAARGTTTLRNAACEPHVQDLARFLATLGAEVGGVGTNTLTVEGGRPLKGAAFALGPDHIEIGSFIGLAAQCEGLLLVFEKLFESRLFFVDKLIGMGARIVLCDPHRAVIAGPSPLRGGVVESPDIRAGMAMLLAALAAQGESVIHNIGQIERGYERIDERLRALGAHIERLEGQPDSRTARR